MPLFYKTIIIIISRSFTSKQATRRCAMLTSSVSSNIPAGSLSKLVDVYNWQSSQMLMRFVLLQSCSRKIFWSLSTPFDATYFRLAPRDAVPAQCMKWHMFDRLSVRLSVRLSAVIQVCIVYKLLLKEAWSLLRDPFHFLVQMYQFLSMWGKQCWLRCTRYTCQFIIFTNMIFAQLCSRWQNFNWHSASRGLSVVVERLVSWFLGCVVVSDAANTLRYVLRYVLTPSCVQRSDCEYGQTAWRMNWHTRLTSALKQSIAIGSHTVHCMSRVLFSISPFYATLVLPSCSTPSRHCSLLTARAATTTTCIICLPGCWHSTAMWYIRCRLTGVLRR